MAGSCIGWLSSWQKWQQRAEAAGAGAVAAGLAVPHRGWGQLHAPAAT